MAATTFNRAWDSVLTTTIDNYRPTLVDNIIKGTALTYWLTRRGKGQGVRYDVGGQYIQIPVVYNKNANTQTISGYDRYNLAPTDEATSAFERWANVNTSCGISLDEMQANKGASRRANLLRMKVDVMETSAREDWERYLVVGTQTGSNIYMSAGNGGKDPVPLAYLLQKGTPANVSIHNINQSTESWWRNKYFDGSTIDTYAKLRAAFNNLYNSCSKGSTNDAPDFGLLTQELYEVLENNMMTFQRADFYKDTESNSMGFGGLSWKGMTLMWSEIMPNLGSSAADAVSGTYSAAEGCGFFINSKWMELVVDEDWDWQITPFEKPIDQWAVWAAMLWRGNLTVTQRRKHGVINGVTIAGITS